MAPKYRFDYRPTSNSSNPSDFGDSAIQPEEYISYIQSGLQPKQFKLLSQGKLPIDAKLDLHGLNLDQANMELEFFLSQSNRVILIIHGKGRRGLIKNLVKNMLDNSHHILAYCSAPNHLGGTGAVLVLLKRSKTLQSD